MQSIFDAVRSKGGVIEKLDTAGLRRRLPHLDTVKDEHGLFHADAGTVLADDAMAALKDKASSLGVMLFEPERVTEIDRAASVRVTTPHRRLRAETVVVAAGPWSGPLLASLGITAPLAPAIAQGTFVAAPDLVDLPGIGEWGGDGEGLGGVYGHPVPGIGYKLAFSTGQEGWSPDVMDWAPDRDEQDRLWAWLDRRMPDFPRQIQLIQRHPWTMTPDGDFIVDRVGPIVLACGCSGHAFKFGPALGPLVADIVEGKPPHPLLRLDRPSLAGKRALASDAISR